MPPVSDWWFLTKYTDEKDDSAYESILMKGEVPEDPKSLREILNVKFVENLKQTAPYFAPVDGHLPELYALVNAVQYAANDLSKIENTKAIRYFTLSLKNIIEAPSGRWKEMIFDAFSK